MRITASIWGALLAVSQVSAIALDVTNTASVKAAASVVAHGMLNYYKGNESGQTPGVLPPPYYWWESGAMFGTLIDYWYYTGDTTYNSITQQAMLFQTGPDYDYMPPNQTKTLGNDDQSFWGLAAMSAAEQKFPDPPKDQPQWLALAQGVWNSQALRWDNSTCGGGLRWQIFTFNAGYNYKNSISNGCFFHLGARLGAYTHNQTYFDWAERSWDWATTIGLIGSQYEIWDGSNDLLNCTDFDQVRWTYNVGVYLYGAAVMWNSTSGANQTKWETRVSNLLNSSSIFFQDSVMFEQACEPSMNCDTDQQSFKAYLSRWMAATTKVAPWTSPPIQPLLAASAQAAAASCSGGTDGVTCGTKWTTGSWDNTWGVGQQMNALEVIGANLISTVRGPVSNTTGGTSIGNPSAGTGGDTDPLAPAKPITTADRAGAGIVTAVVLITILGVSWWMLG